MPGRRASWKTSSQRRSRSGAGGNSSAAGGGGMSSVYAKQLNPYKLKSSSRRESPAGLRDSDLRGVSDDDLGITDDDLDIALSDDGDDDLGLDNILSSLEAINDRNEKQKAEAAKAGSVDSAANTQTKQHVDEDPKSTSTGGYEKTNENGSDEHLQKPKIPHISQVDFGHGLPVTPDTPPPPIQNTTCSIDNEGNISPVSEEDNDTLWTDGDATRQHRMMAETGEGPAFASGGFEGATERLETSMTGPSFQAGSKAGSSLVGTSFVDSLIDDIGVGDDADAGSFRVPEVQEPPLSNNSKAMTPTRGVRYSRPYNQRAQAKTSDNTDPSLGNSSSDDKLSELVQDPPPKKRFGSDRNNNNPPTKVTTTRKGKPEDETLSTVTDPTESPFIYTYNKSGDDDSVSQITSSLAGSSLASSNLQNIPMNTTSSSRRSHGLSWMNGGAAGGSRMIRRKPGGGMIIPGPYGRRDKSAGRSTKYGSGNGKASRGSSHSGSGSAEGSVGGGASFDGGKGNGLDEIDYALNADSGRKGQRGPTSRRPPGRPGGQYLRNDHSMEDLSTVESSRDGLGDLESGRQPYISTNINSNVSRLGMGGVSTGQQSVAEASVLTESTAGTLGVVQSLAMFAWKAQHHISRYLFPKSKKVEKRKKFDSSDSMSDLEDILLEEGASSLPHRKSRGSRRGSSDDNDEEEIDYFSRAMSISNNYNNNAGRRSNKRREKNFWKTGNARVGGGFLLLTVAIIVYRMPERDGGGPNANLLLNNQVGEFRTGTERFYDPVQYQDGNNDGRQALNYDNNAAQDQLGQPENNVAASDEGQVAAAADSESLAAFDAKNALLQEQQQQEDHFLVHGNIHLPEKFEVLANVDEGLFQRGIDVPFYWHVPRSGGGTMNDVLGSCLHLTLAADAGGSDGHGQEEALKIIHFSKKVAYVNVDTSTHQGIARAKNLNLVSSGLADAVISPLLHEATTLFTPTRRGRMFTIVRHPVERAASLFYFIQETQWRQPATRNEQFADITIDTFYRKGFAESNWMTRFLTNELTKGELTENDLDIAKEVLRQKCLVGLLEEKGESFDRILKLFGWRPKNEEEQNCLQKKLEYAWPMKHKHPEIEEDSRAWRLIVAANKMDMKLYEYAKDLFVQQGQLFRQ